MVGYKVKSIKKHTGLLRHKSLQDTGNIQKPVVSVYKSSYLEYQSSVCVWYVCACLRSCFTACHRGASSPWTLPRFSRPLLLLPSWKRPSPPFWPQGMIHAQTHATSVYPDPYHWNHSNQRAQIQVTSPFCTPGKRLLHLNFAGEDMQTSHNKPTSMPVCREPIQVVPSPLRHLPSAAQRDPKGPVHGFLKKTLFLPVSLCFGSLKARNKEDAARTAAPRHRMRRTMAKCFDFLNL